MPFWKPTKAMRKERAGQECPACTIHMHHIDVIGWTGEEGTIFLHEQCARLLTEMAPDDDIQEENPPAAE